MNEKEKENVKEAEEEEEEEEEEGIWVREQRKRKRSRRRRRREEQLADRLDLAPASDRGQRQRQRQRQWQRAEVRGQTSMIFFFFFNCKRVGAALEPCQSRVGEAKKKKKRETLVRHRNQASRIHTGVRHVSDTNTTPKMACPCNLAPSRSHQHFPLMQKKECTNSIPFLFSPNLLFII